MRGKKIHKQRIVAEYSVYMAADVSCPKTQHFPSGLRSCLPQKPIQPDPLISDPIIPEIRYTGCSASARCPPPGSYQIPDWMKTHRFLPLFLY